jgi:hypothetical protein
MLLANILSGIYKRRKRMDAIKNGDILVFKIMEMIPLSLVMPEWLSNKLLIAHIIFSSQLVFTSIQLLLQIGLYKIYMNIQPHL